MGLVRGTLWREGPLLEALDRGEWERVVVSLALALLRLWETLPVDAVEQLVGLLEAEHG
jgi:hypothetical protein